MRRRLQKPLTSGLMTGQLIILSQKSNPSENTSNFGKTFVRFQDNSPRYKPMKIEDTLFPARTPLSPKKWKILFAKDKAGFNELWELVIDKESEKKAKERGWDLTMVKAVLSAAVEKGEEETQYG